MKKRFVVGFVLLTTFMIFFVSAETPSCVLSAPFSCDKVSALGDLDEITFGIENTGDTVFVIQSIVVSGCNEGNITQELVSLFSGWEGSYRHIYVSCDSDVLTPGEVFNADVKITYHVAGEGLLTLVSTGVISVIPVKRVIANTCFSSDDVRSSAVVLHRRHRFCSDGTVHPYSMKGLEEQNIVINSDKRQYCNVVCKFRAQEQCYDDGSFDTYYMEWCEDGNGNKINVIDAAVSWTIDEWPDAGYDCYSDVDCPYGKVCIEGYCKEGDVGTIQCTRNSECQSGEVCENYKCVDTLTLDQCKDSDLGFNVFKKGIITVNEKYYDEDICIFSGEAWPSGKGTCFGNECGLAERFCDPFTGEAKFEKYRCEKGCFDGACIIEPTKKCTDSDGGGNYYEKGYVTDSEGRKYTDYCNQRTFFTGRAITEPDPTEPAQVDLESYSSEIIKGNLVEYVCSVDEEGNDFVSTNNFHCENGCFDGACKGKRRVVEDIEKEFLCSNGCSLDKKCYVYGYRIDGDYCSNSNSFVVQKLGELKCDNNFECSSNVCISDRCVSEGFIKKILNWFSRLF